MGKKQFSFTKIVFWAVVAFACIDHKDIFRAVKRTWESALRPARNWLAESQRGLTFLSRNIQASIAFHMILLIILLIYRNPRRIESKALDQCPIAIHYDQQKAKPRELDGMMPT